MTLGLGNQYYETWGPEDTIPEPDPSAEHFQSTDAIAKWNAEEERIRQERERMRSFAKGSAAALAVATISPEKGEKASKPDLHEASNQFISEIEGLKDKTPAELSSAVVDAWIAELNEVHNLGDTPNFEKYIKAAVSNHIMMRYGVVAGTGTFSTQELMTVERWHDLVISYAALVEGTFEKARQFAEEQFATDKLADEYIFDEDRNITDNGIVLLIQQMIANEESDFRIFFLAQTFGITLIEDLPNESHQTVYKNGIQLALDNLVGTRNRPFLENPQRGDYHALFDEDKINAALGRISSITSTENNTSLLARFGLKEELGTWRDIAANRAMMLMLSK